MSRVACETCPRHCRLADGEFGACRARRAEGGRVVCASYGRITSLALDPIEKKPLAFFHPGSFVLSVGSFGCNLSCPFCQNYGIAAAREAEAGRLYRVTPEELCALAEGQRSRGNIGVAYTYNEALVGYEFVRDTAKLVREAGMLNVLVTNGTAELPVLEEILPYIDAMNIDLKGFTSEIYRYLGGDLETVKRFIARAAEACHVELTTLVVPGMNDDAEDMRREAAWIAGIDPGIPLHITRYFPRYKMKRPPTDIAVMRRLETVAREYLTRVRLGNV
jgi:pyruvate formate lyase activating enzyme